MQDLALRHSQRIMDENKKLRSDLESKMQLLDSRSKELDKLAVQSNSDRMNLEKEKEKVCDVLFLFLILFLSHKKDTSISFLLLLSCYIVLPHFTLQNVNLAIGILGNADVIYVSFYFVRR